MWTPEGRELVWTPFHPLGYTETPEWQHRVLGCNLEPLQHPPLSLPISPKDHSDKSKGSATQGREGVNTLTPQS